MQKYDMPKNCLSAKIYWELNVEKERM